MTDTVPSFFLKSHGDTLPYSWDWRLFLPADANGIFDTIITATITGAPSGLTIGPVTIAGMVTTATVSGGVAGTSYALEADITTASGIIACSQEILNVREDVR